MPPQIFRRLGGRRILTTAVAGATLATMVIGPLAHTAADAAPPKPPARPGSSHSVTLITGDVVKVTEVGAGQYMTDVQRPRGASGGVRTETIGKDLYVFPDEAIPFIAAGKFDKRLFDVTGLIEQGYDDEHSDGIPLILSYADKTAAQKPVPQGTKKLRSLASVRGTAVKATKREARKVWDAVTPDAVATVTAAAPKPVLADGITKIWLDGKVHVDLADSTTQIGAPTAWASGYTGEGVKVAILDTGVDLNHPDFQGRISTTATFVPGQTVQDGHGHGTHTASTVGGSGAASGGLEQGVAPKSDLIIGKILADEGYGEDSWVIAGMEWAAAQGARVISMSIGGSESTDGTDPLSSAVNQLTAQYGSLFVVAAGNAGAEAVISSPGAADAALTVAATDSNDQLAEFSSKGPRYGDYALKPDISGPGVDILAAKAGGTAEDGYYQTMSGTSMATPHVAGAAAILAQQHPDWHAAELKNALMSTSKILTDYTPYQVGAGRVDIPAGMNAKVTATGSAYFGFFGYPQTSLAPVERTLTYTNTGDAAVSLDLAVTGAIAGGPYDVDPHADEGTPAPGVFTLSTDTLVVPAHGTASVTATAHPDLGTQAHRYLGQVTATENGTLRTHTALGFYIEEERHNLTISVKDRSGDYVQTWLEVQKFGEMDPYYLETSASGPTTVRMRPGTFSALAYLDVPGNHGPESMGLAQLGDPEIILDRDRTVVLDARQAKEVTATVPKRTEDRMMIMEWTRSDGGDSTIASQYILPPWDDTMWVLPTKQVTVGTFEYATRWRKAYPLLTLADRGKNIGFLGLAGSPRYDGQKQLDAEYVGTGTPDEYAGHDVRGKAVLVTRTDGVEGWQRAQAAADAGAEMVIVVNDSPAKLLDWAGTEEGTMGRITNVSVTSTTGQPLIDRARRGLLHLDVEGTPNSPYTYDLVDPHLGKIPATGLTYKPQPGDLAIVNMRFHGATQAEGAEFRADYRPGRHYGAGFPLWQDTAVTRTDYLSAQPGTRWADSAIGGVELELVSVGDIYSVKPGSRTTVDLFGAVARPRNNNRFWSATRFAGWMQFNIQPWSDGGKGHAGYMEWGDQLTLTISRNGELLSTRDGWASGFLEEDPEGTSIYALDLKASRDPAKYPLSTSTHTAWQVVSKPVAHPDDLDTMPMLQLDYAVDTDLAGNARGGVQRLGLSAVHLDGAVGAGKVAGATLAVSYDDGATWQNVSLVRSGAGWVANFTAPATGFVSLKATAWDAVGNRIEQEITRAYGLSTPGSN